MLSLSKLNWNVTQFDGGEPITVRALGVGGSGDADDLFFEQENKRIYVSAGAGNLDVFNQVAADHYQAAATITTVSGA